VEGRKGRRRRVERCSPQERQMGSGDDNRISEFALVDES